MTQKVATDTQQLTETIIAGLQDKKGLAITVMDLRKLQSAVSNYFVIATGTSDRHCQALAGSVEDKVRKTLGEKPFNIEGQSRGEWILLDYVDVVVHVFLRDKREFYNIEELWGDAEIRYVEDLV